jgi:hypothetical protein
MNIIYINLSVQQMEQKTYDEAIDQIKGTESIEQNDLHLNLRGKIIVVHPSVFSQIPLLVILNESKKDLNEIISLDFPPKFMEILIEVIQNERSVQYLLKTLSLCEFDENKNKKWLKYLGMDKLLAKCYVPEKIEGRIVVVDIDYNDDPMLMLRERVALKLTDGSYIRETVGILTDGSYMRGKVKVTDTILLLHEHEKIIVDGKNYLNILIPIYSKDKHNISNIKCSIPCDNITSLDNCYYIKMEDFLPVAKRRRVNYIDLYTMFFDGYS